MRLRPRIRSCLLTAILAAMALAFGGSTARAAVSVFTDREMWAAAAGATSFAEDFSGFAVDAPFHTMPVALNGMSISREGPQPGDSNLVDALPLAFPGGSGTNQGAILVNAIEGNAFGTNIRIAFAQPNLAFGVDVWGADDDEGARIDLYDGAMQLRTQQVPAGSGAFIGFVCTDGTTASSVLFRSNSLTVGGTGEAFFIDNLAGMNVPEPAGAALSLIGAIGLASRRRRA